MFAVVNIFISSIILCCIFIAGDVVLEDGEEKYLNLKTNSGTMPRIGIIGAGIGGAATSYFLRNAFHENVLLHIYESNQVGGRLSLSSKFSAEYETGGSIIHPENEYMNKFVKLLGLQKSYGCSSKFAIFDGKDYSFIESNWDWINIFKYIWRYGFDIYKLNDLTNKMLKKFSRIYDLQNAGVSFTTVDDLLRSMDSDFPSLMRKTMRSYLKEQNLGDLIINELITACTRVNYGQLPDINAFVGSVAVAGATPGLWSVVGGNKNVPEELIKYSEPTLLKRFVSAISSEANGKYKICSEDIDPLKEDSKQCVEYDAVVIATPLTQDTSSIRFVNFSKDILIRGAYEKIVSTLVQGDLNASTFKFKEAGGKIEEILTTNPDLPFNSVGRQRSVNNNTCSDNTPKIYKVFSPNVLSDDDLSSLFDRFGKVEVKEWRAYPHYSLNDRHTLIELAPGLYYNNAIEQAASAMEMSAIAAKNSALLVEKFITKKDPIKLPEEKDEL